MVRALQGHRKILRASGRGSRGWRRPLTLQTVLGCDMGKMGRASRTASQHRERSVRAKNNAQPGQSAPRRRGGAKPRRTVRQKDSFLVVGIGASAGGLEAATKLLRALPPDTGIAFVLIQHLDPSHSSMMVDLLARETAIKVFQAAEGMRIMPNCLYVIPPQADLSVHHGVLRLSPLQVRDGVHLPFDFFLHSLADEYGERAGCVILSGTGRDGSLGLRAVSEHGGLVIAQDPGEAAHDGMPRNAIATGAVNLVLPAGKIAPALVRHARYPERAAARQTAQPDEATDQSLASIIKLLRSRTSHDFTHYKNATLVRRIRRRMGLAGIKKVDDYLKMLRKNSSELEQLAKDLLIHVTRFFRDPEAYEALAKTVIPELVRQHTPDQPIRIWVPGCSSGEEAYSLAMLFLEELSASKRSTKLQVFASDVSPEAIANGRKGVFPESIGADVSQERLARFFVRESDGYRVRRELRDSIVFTVQDLLTDPPFSRLDLVSCRNVLIYLQPDEQEKVLSLLHHALRQGGILFLGISESVGKLPDLFEAVPDTVRAFRRIGGDERREQAIASNIRELARSLWPRVVAHGEPKRPNLNDFTQRLLLEAYAPASVLVSRKYQGLYFFGPTDRYLRVAGGEPNRLVPAMLREGLAAKFQAAVRQASREQKAVTVHGARVKRNGGYVMVSISARPVQHENEELLLVSFVDEPEQETVRARESPVQASRAAQLSAELESTRQELESTIHELNASNQELTALNEEAVSLNEEFQSTNEELETSKEELQSLNEELATANTELQESLEQQSKTSADLQNILNSSQVATLFLDRDLRVRFFTPLAAPLFNLIATDLGRPLSDLATHFSGIDLLADARSVLGNLTPIQREVQGGAGRWYLCGLSPYRASEERIGGIVINLADISDMKAGEENLRLARAYTSAVIGTIHEPLVVLDHELRVEAASDSFYDFFGGSPEASFGRPLLSIDANHLDAPTLRAFLERNRGTSNGAESCEIAIDMPSRGQRTLLVTAGKIRGGSTADQKILVSFSDVTEVKRASEGLATKQRAELANLAKSRFLAAASHDLRQPLQTLSLLQGALRQRLKDEESLTVLAKAERTLAAMSATLNALLDINQLEAGVIRPKLVDFSINEILGIFKGEFGEVAIRKGLRWRVVPCGLTVRSDRQLLEDMIRNLLSNAVRYTDTGTILLGCRRHGGRVRIEVWDTGVGIAEDQVPHIFKEYHRATDQHRQDSVGLGLAIVRQLGEVLGHPVGVRSVVGKGSVFFIEVPVVTAKPGRGHGTHVPAAGVGNRRRVGTILLIEDEESVRDSLELLLKKDGHHVAAVANGEAALALVANRALRPDLVISDYRLSGKMNGVGAAVQLRERLGSEVPVIILTGDVRVVVLRDIAKHGYLSRKKPVKAEELLQDIQRLLGPRELATRSALAAPAAEAAIASAAATVYVVDDDGGAREAMEMLLAKAGYSVETYASAATFLESYRPGQKACLLTDVRMPGMSGFELLAQLAAAGNALPAIVITGQGDVAMAVEAMRAGAVDFIEKPIDADALLAGVNRALRQAASPAERSSWRKAAAMRIAGLTSREREVMDLVVAGCANKDISARLRINQRTVETHRAAVMKKVGATSLSELVRLELAARAGESPAP
jgi:two-component system, chemotaxis family, CheB/CheR fusion protein